LAKQTYLKLISSINCGGNLLLKAVPNYRLGFKMNRILNKKIIVVGGTSGIGKSIVKKFTEEGANVAFCGRSNEKGDAIENSCKNARYFPCDITIKDDIKQFFDNAIAYLGNLDIAINNAGISGEICPFHETSDELLKEVMETNFFGIWHSLQHEVKYFIEKNRAGSIINISSTSGLIGNALGLTPYSASKHALIGLTKSIALEYARFNIRINALCPGFVDTPMTDKAGEYSKTLKRKIPLMHPMGRIATTEEIANAALYLSSDEASFTTGSCLVVDGGLTA
jgi:NAD(P)-dependent dehydrogenase (short-subunit alcohol dehydrogenase family)